MQAAYILTRDDLLQYHRASLSRSQQVRPWLQRVAAGFLASVGVLGLAIFLIPTRGATTPPAVYALVYLALVVSGLCSLWQLSPWRLERLVDRRLRAGVDVLGKYVITLDPEGVEEITPKGRSKIAWQNVMGMDQNASFLTVLYRDAVNVRGFVTPKRAFESSDAASDFYDAAMFYCQAASLNLPTEEGVWPPPPRRTV